MEDDQTANGSFRQVEDWLRSLGLICYAQSFYDNGYENLEICRLIEEQDLAVIGITNVKDKNDILAGVCRLKQKAVYFELEPEEDLSAGVVRRKYDPFLLITRVKAELEKDNVQLTEPPYFYPDGSLGSLDSLAETVSFKLETFVEDVQGALDQLRRRQLPAGLYNDVNEMMEMQRQQEVKKNFNMNLIGPPKPKREVVEEPGAYLDVETPSFRRTTSLSKHDKRITKSTTNLADIDLGEDKSLVLERNKKSKKTKSVVKSYSSREKSKNLFGLSIRKRSTTAENKANLNRESYVAKDLTMNQQELIDLMMKVKHGEMSQDKVVAQATLNYRQSILGDPATHRGLEKHQLTKKEKKKLDKEEKKRKKTERVKASGHSLFYTSEINENLNVASLTSDVMVESGQVEDVISLGHSSGSDVSRESPDLRTFSEGKMKGKLNNGTALRTSEDSIYSSNGSVNSQSGTPNIRESRAKSRSNSVKSVTKPTKEPPPIPVRSDQPSEASIGASQLSSGNVLGSFTSKKPLKPTLSAPPSKVVTKTEVLNPELPASLTASKSQEFSTKTPSNVGKDTNAVNSVTFTHATLEQIKLKSLERKQRLTDSAKDNDEVTRFDIKTGKGPPKPPERSDRTVAIPAPNTGPSATSTPRPICEVSHDNIVASTTEAMARIQNEAVVKNVEVLKPAPPPRRIEKPTENRPVIPPRKRRSVSCEASQDKNPDTDIPKATSNSIPGAYKPITKPKPSLPPRSELHNIDEACKVTEGNTHVAGMNDLTESKGSAIKSEDVNDRSLKMENGLLKSKAKFTPRSVKQLIEMKCEKEHVQLCEYPYTNHDGSWNVPHLLIKRYSEELDRPLAQIIDVMDSVRIEMAEKRGQSAKRVIIKDVIDNKRGDSMTTSLQDWLISKGLPMFIKDFTECGLLLLEDLHSMTKTDILSAGVFDDRHVDQLLEYLK